MPPDAAALFPAVQPFDCRTVKVDQSHTLYLEQFGARDGLPVVFLHGGPGSGCQRDHARLFDPKRFRAVLFDQRGAGRSTPKRCLTDNTTWHLVADIERIRQALEIERWMVVGGSWGSTLALAYAQTHPDRVSGMVLRAVFLGTPAESDWAFRRAAQTFYPELWRAFVALLPPDERDDPIAAYGRRLQDTDPRVHVPAARVWGAYEQALSVLEPNSTALPGTLDGERGIRSSDGPNTPYMEWHYISQNCFLAPDQLRRDAGKLAAVPGIMVQGRYDLLCPPAAAAAVAEPWTAGELRLVDAAGHAASEIPIRNHLVAAIAEMGERLSA